MGQPGAKGGDQVLGTDIQIVLVPSAAGPVPTPLPHLFAGKLTGGLSPNVKIMGIPAATAGSTATNTPMHIPTPPGVSFQVPPTNQAQVLLGSTTVMINGKMAARNGDMALTCNDPTSLPSGTIVAMGTVLIGG